MTICVSLINMFERRRWKEAEADQIRAASQIQVTDLHRRAMHRFLEEEAKKQSNIESITQQALPLLEDKAGPQNVADDWITKSVVRPRQNWLFAKSTPV